MYTALPTPTRCPTITAFNCLFILPTGNTKPARDDLDLPEPKTSLDDASFPLTSFLTGTAFILWVILSRDPVLARAWLNFFFSLWWISLWMGAGGGGGLLSNKASGILATAYIIVELLYASFPTLSRVSNILNDGKRVNICARYPAYLTTGLLSKSNWSNCLKLRSGFKSYIF